VTRYLTLAEYFWLAEQVSGNDATVLIKAARVELADSALHAPSAGFGDDDFYPDLADKAASGRNPRPSGRAGSSGRGSQSS
jgi:death on curing protein